MKAIFTCSLIFVQGLFFTGLYGQNINTIIGGLGDHGAATTAELYSPSDIAVDRSGNIYIADRGNDIVRKVSNTGIITIYAGVPGGSSGSTSNVTLAILTEIGSPGGVVTDTFRNVYFASNGRIRKVDTSGIITTYAGGGSSSSDSIPATSASLSCTNLGIDRSGNIYIVDYNKIRKVTTSGIITTVAGTGISGFSGDTRSAATAQLNNPVGVCVDRSGNIFISDNGNNRIRKVDASGIITTFAGNGGIGYAGDGSTATTANFNKVMGIAADSSGNIYIADNNNNIIRKVSTSGIITTVAGSFLSGGFSGDGGTADTARLSGPTGVTTDLEGNFYIADNLNNRVRKVNAAGIITTVAGCNLYTAQGFKGDGGPAVSALLNHPAGLAYDTAQNLYIADYNNSCVRKVNTSGIISTFAGNDTSGYSGDGGPAIHAKLNSPSSLAIDKKGNVYICDPANNRIRKVSNTGIISTYAGTGLFGFTGDGHRADSAKLNSPSGIAIDAYGDLFVADESNNRIRKVDTNQIITTIAGTGVGGYFGDGGPATAAQLTQPYGVCTDNAGNVFIADYGNLRVRKIDATGVISTVAGGATGGIGGLAILYNIGNPVGILIDKAGNLYIPTYNRLVYKVNNAGIIYNYVSSGSGGGFGAFYGDGGPAINAQIDNGGGGISTGIVTDTSGDLLIPDSRNNRIRKVYNANISISTLHDTICTGSGATFTAVATYASVYAPYYHWQKNGLNIGTNSTVFTAAPGSLNNGDKITCYITNGATGPSLAVSNQVNIVIIPPGVTPSVHIVADNGICTGTAVVCTPNPVNGGTAPIYDWYKNGAHVFTGGTYSFTPVNNDTVYCKLTSSLPCLITDTAISADFIFTVNTPATPSISIAVIGGSVICTGTSVMCHLFSISNEGSPPVYQWYKNGSYVYTGDPYNFTPVNGDIVTCKLTSNASCIFPDTAMSNTITFTVDSPANPSVSVSVSPGDTVCPGSTVICTPVSILGGSSPVYYWYKNGSRSYIGNTFTFNPINTDVIYCMLLSNSNCILTDTAISGNITFAYPALLVPSVSFSVSPGDTVCSGNTITCTATSVNGGSSPAYYWHKNGQLVNIGSNPYNFAPDDGDVLYCFLRSNAACLSTDSATSSNTTFRVNPTVVPSINISITPGTTMCTGIEAQCSATGTDTGNAPVYDWFLNNNQVATGNQYNFTPVGGDQLYCRLTSNATCASPQSVSSNTSQFRTDSLGTATISSSPNQINFRGTTVTFYAAVSGNSGSYSYQWIKNGIPVPHADSSVFSTNNFSVWDSIKCVVTETGTCQGTAVSNTIVIDTYHGMKLYPDPNNGDFIINGNNYDANSDKVNIRIFNTRGQLVYEKNTAFNAITFYTEINLANELPSGVYLLRLRYDLENLSFIFAVKH